jgi:hypothetical protein
MSEEKLDFQKKSQILRGKSEFQKKSLIFRGKSDFQRKNQISEESRIFRGKIRFSEKVRFSEETSDFNDKKFDYRNKSQTIFFEKFIFVLRTKNYGYKKVSFSEE